MSSLSVTEAALHTSKTMLSQYGADLCVCLRNTFGVVFFGVPNGQIKGDRIHQRASGSSKT